HFYLHSFPTRRSSDLLSLLVFKSLRTSIECETAQQRAMCFELYAIVSESFVIIISVLNQSTGTSHRDARSASALPKGGGARRKRSEEHTSELQSLAYL